MDFGTDPEAQRLVNWVILNNQRKQNNYKIRSLTAEYMKSRGITVRGIILNHYETGNRLHEDNAFMCRTLTGLDVVAYVKDGDTDLDIPVERLKTLYEENGGKKP